MHSLLPKDNLFKNVSYTWHNLLIHLSEEIGEKQFSVLGSRGGRISPLMHLALSESTFASITLLSKYQIVMVIAQASYIERGCAHLETNI